MNHWLKSLCAALAAGAAVCGGAAPARAQAPSTSQAAHVLGSIQGLELSVSVGSDGSYSIASPGISGAVIRSDVEAEVDSRVLRSSAYPQHRVVQAESSDDFGAGSTLTVNGGQYHA